MGEQGIPLVKKWTALGKLDFSNSEEDALSSGYILQNYWNLLEAEFRPKADRNRILQVPRSSATDARRLTPKDM